VKFIHAYRAIPLRAVVASAVETHQSRLRLSARHDKRNFHFADPATGFAIHITELDEHRRPVRHPISAGFEP